MLTWFRASGARTDRSTFHKSKRHHPTRRLRTFEQLAARAVFSADLATAEPLPQPEAQAPAAVDVAPDTGDVWLYSEEDYGPSLESYDYESESYGGDCYGGDCYGGDPTIPVVVEFRIDNLGSGEWKLYGWVTDDSSVANLMMYFGGDWQGDCPISADGSFTKIVYAPSWTSGFLSATFTDTDSNAADTVYAEFS